MKSISREHRIYILHPENEPAVTIDSGDDLMVETWDAFEGIREPGVLQEKSLKGPATGPIYVNGAEPGDTLAHRVRQHQTQGKPGPHGYAWARFPGSRVH